MTKCSYHKCLNMSSISVDIVSKKTLFSLFNCLFLFFVLWMCSLVGLFFPFKMDDRRIFSQFYLQKSLLGRFSVWIFHEEVVFLRILQGFNSFLRLSFYNYLIKGQYLKLKHFHCLFSLQQWLKPTSLFVLFFVIYWNIVLPICTINSSGFKSFKVEFRWSYISTW